MKTLEEIEGMVDLYGRQMIRSSQGYANEKRKALIPPALTRTELFADLATLHMLASLKAQELREELAGLERLRDAQTYLERRDAFLDVYDSRSADARLNSEGDEYRLSTFGLARIAEIRRMIGKDGT